MKPCGVILTFMDLRKVKKYWFNIPLFVFQLTFMIAGTAYGKIKAMRKVYTIEKRLMIVVLICAVGGIFCMVKISRLMSLPISIYWTLPYWIFSILFAIASLRGIDWRRTWRAAQVSHVRLVLEKAITTQLDCSMALDSGPLNFRNIIAEEKWRTANFGYRFMEIQLWRPGQIDRKHFRYFDPTFDPSPQFIAAMIEYARDQEGKRYDTLQLFSFGLNFIFWLWPPWWGKEKLKWLNLRGAREVCSSGIAANLRWADKQAFPKTVYDMNEKDVMWVAWIFTSPECRYDTAMVSPCLFAIDNNWEKI